MPNPLYESMKRQPMGGMGDMARQFQQFKAGFRGDPKAQVQQLLNSGQMTQAQYDQLSRMAQQLMGVLKG